MVKAVLIFKFIFWVFALATVVWELKVIVFNKTREYRGRCITIQVNEWMSIGDVKRLIEEQTGVPRQIQWITFACQALSDEKKLYEYHIRDGYTLYSTPTLVEIPNQPNL